jgi:chemotaxis response regulator CheB
MITVFLVDRSDAMRRALHAYLTLATDLQVIGEASEDAEARALVRQLRPNVVVLDAEMSTLDVHATARVIRASSPGTAVVVHALNPDALAADGSTRVVGKHQGEGALLAAIRVAAADRTC